MPGEWGDVLQALGLHTEDAPSDPLVSMGGQTPAQLAAVPEQRANMLLSALGPLGEAGMTLGEMLRTRQFDARMLPQIAGGVLLGTAAPGGLETGAAEHGLVTLGKTMAEDVPSLSEAAIEKALAANPGASIFDLAAPAGKSSTYTALKNIPAYLRTENFPREIPFSVPNRAESTGINVPAIHGTTGPAESWKTPTGSGAALGGRLDALKMPEGELGVHFGNPKQAKQFSAPLYAILRVLAGQGNNITPRSYPVLLRANNPLELEDRGTWYPSDVGPQLAGLFPEDAHKFADMDIQDMRNYILNKGYDSVKYVNKLEDAGYPSYIMFQPSTVEGFVGGVRSPFAQFDPNKLSWPELAAGLAGAGAIPALAHEEGQQE